MPPQDPSQPQGPQPAPQFTPMPDPAVVNPTPLPPAQPLIFPQQPGQAPQQFQQPVAPQPLPQQPMATPQNFAPQPMQPNMPVPQPPMPAPAVGMPPQQSYAQPQPLGGMMSQPFQQYPSANSSSGNKGLIKKLILAGVGLIALVVVAVIGLVVFQKFSGAVPTYTVSDLKEFKTGSYTAAAPKQWADVSDKEGIKKELAKSDADKITDAKIYAYKYNDSGATYSAALLTGQMAFPATDTVLNQVLASEYKTEFGDEIKSSFGDVKDEDCSTLTKGPVDVLYNTGTYIIEITASYDCIFKEDIAKKRGIAASHYEFRVGIKGGKSYMTVLVVTAPDWKKNQTFYSKDLLSSVKPL